MGSEVTRSVHSYGVGRWIWREAEEEAVDQSFFYLEKCDIISHMIHNEKLSSVQSHNAMRILLFFF